MMSIDRVSEAVKKADGDENKLKSLKPELIAVNQNFIDLIHEANRMPAEPNGKNSFLEFVLSFELEKNLCRDSFGHEFRTFIKIH